MRLKVKFSYLGKEYYGYQRQVGKRTIQGELEKALSSFFDQNISLVASGRTDAGVSAVLQIGHFDIMSNNIEHEFDEKNKYWQSAVIRINYLLPDDIRLLELEPIEDSFHSRFIAKKKTYCYNFYCSKIEIPYLSQFCLWVKENSLDINSMKQALEIFIGEHDFSSFCASNTEVEDKVRQIYSANIIKNELGFYTIIITGNGFLYNMVRIIVGTILDVGRGKIGANKISEIIKGKDRKLAGKTVSSKGLVLMNIEV